MKVTTNAIIMLYHNIARIHRNAFTRKNCFSGRDYTEEKTALSLHYWTAPKSTAIDVRFFFALIHLEFCTPKDKAHEKIRI